jgi:hypothetical protein
MRLSIRPRIGTRVGRFYVGANIYSTNRRTASTAQTRRAPAAPKPRAARRQVRNIQRMATQQGWPQASQPQRTTGQHQPYPMPAPRPTGAPMAAAGKAVAQAYIILLAFLFLCAVVVMVVSAVARIVSPTTVVIVPSSVPSISASHVPSTGLGVAKITVVRQ